MSAKVDYSITKWHYDDEAIEAEKKLIASGFISWQVVVAKSNELQIDFDKKSDKLCHPPNFQGIMRFLMQRFNCKRPLKYKIAKSKGRGNHITIYLPKPIDDMERIAWQAIFASDGKREALNLLRVKRGIKNPILLFQKKEA